MIRHILDERFILPLINKWILISTHVKFITAINSQMSINHFEVFHNFLWVLLSLFLEISNCLWLQRLWEFIPRWFLLTHSQRIFSRLFVKRNKKSGDAIDILWIFSDFYDNEFYPFSRLHCGLYKFILWRSAGETLYKHQNWTIWNEILVKNFWIIQNFLLSFRTKCGQFG